MSTAGKNQKVRPGPAPKKGIPAGLFYGMFAVLFTTNALTALVLYMSGDLTRIMGSQNDVVVSAYEDRLAQMRVEIDRLNSRVYAQAGDINLQLHEVSAQQDVLLEQQQLVRVLVDKASQMGIASLPRLSMPQVSDPGDVGATADAISLMIEETQAVMVAIASTASERSRTISTELIKLGISYDTIQGDLAVGGPYLPPIGAIESGDALASANAVMSALLRYKSAKDRLDKTPVHMPLSANSYRTSSGYGNRTDPFTRERAFHSGLDFAAPTGTSVLAAADGLVTFVGTKPGYGKTVEITHADGLVSRYGHLSGYLTKPGQEVRVGVPIALVGSTGRSTGPHLHFEVRKSDQALDPKPFLDTGKRLHLELG